MSMDRGMDKEIVIHSGILVIKRDAFESVLMRWMNLEPIIQKPIFLNLLFRNLYF